MIKGSQINQLTIKDSVFKNHFSNKFGEIQQQA